MNPAAIRWNSIPLAFAKRAWAFFLTLLLLAACRPEPVEPSESKAKAEVIIYTALDQIYSEPILKEFETRTGIQVRAVYDSEAAKTVGLVNRLIAERARPRCDVFWNNEIIRTIRLKKEGILESYPSPAGKDIPPAFKDPEGCWTGFAARARVIAFNTTLVAAADVPKTLSDLTGARWKGKAGMAYPLFGSTATQAAALFAAWGEPRARAFFEALKANNVHILDGNMAVCRAVANGELPLGLTDTDDANSVREEGKPIDYVLIDHDGQGALLISNTLALIKGGPNPDAGRKLIDYLLSPEVEGKLAASPSAQIPLHPGVAAPPKVAQMAKGPFMQVDFAKAEEMLTVSADFLKTLFTQP